MPEMWLSKLFFEGEFFSTSNCFGKLIPTQLQCKHLVQYPPTRVCLGDTQSRTSIPPTMPRGCPNRARFGQVNNIDKYVVCRRGKAFSPHSSQVSPSSCWLLAQQSDTKEIFNSPAFAHKTTAKLWGKFFPPRNFVRFGPQTRLSRCFFALRKRKTQCAKLSEEYSSEKDVFL